MSDKSVWFPEKGERATRPEAVRGSLKIQRSDADGFRVTFRFKLGRVWQLADGSGDTPPEAMEDACGHAEYLWQRYQEALIDVQKDAEGDPVG